MRGWRVWCSGLAVDAFKNLCLRISGPRSASHQSIKTASSPLSTRPIELLEAGSVPAPVIAAEARPCIPRSRLISRFTFLTRARKRHLHAVSRQADQATRSRLRESRRRRRGGGARSSSRASRGRPPGRRARRPPKFHLLASCGSSCCAWRFIRCSGSGGGGGGG